MTSIESVLAILLSRVKSGQEKRYIILEDENGGEQTISVPADFDEREMEITVSKARGDHDITLHNSPPIPHFVTGREILQYCAELMEEDEDEEDEGGIGPAEDAEEVDTEDEDTSDKD